jgi:hypothetical protein
MCDTLNKYSFIDLVKEVGKIRIPKIQRDYAQGRQTKKVNEIRKTFVRTLVQVVKGKIAETELDFVYGSNDRGAFEPLDGQQRLTTLFLLHWILGVELTMPDDKQSSVFTYETRNTSTEFCDELVQHNAKQFIDEANDKSSTPAEIIKARDWFKWEWKYDPTISSMLVMIDSIVGEIGKDWDDNSLATYRENLKKITFNRLNLGDFGLSNELFIKMNARGKLLSDFDKLKSTLEEELQLQRSEKDEKGVTLVSEEVEEKWRSHMDGTWIDLFWHKYARNQILDSENYDQDLQKTTRLAAAKLSENQFKKLLLRLIAMQLFANDAATEPLWKTAYTINEDKLDDLLLDYADSLVDLRSHEGHQIDKSKVAIIDFNQLIDDINLLIYKDSNDTYNEITSILPQISHINNDEATLFETFLEPKVANDVQLIFYALILYMRNFPAAKSKKVETEDEAWYFDPEIHKGWRKNLECWVRSIRNILLNDNNNQRIDNRWDAYEIVKSLNIMVSDLTKYVTDNNLNIETESNAIRMFFKSLEGKTYKQIDNQSLKEEVDKAILVLDNPNDVWEDALNDAESDSYFWGQIRCLLNWSNGDIKLFREYSMRLMDLLNYERSYRNEFYTLQVIIYPECWHNNARLYVDNKDRDNSFKRHLRDFNADSSVYGINLKKIIDLWKESYKDFTIEDFAKNIFEKNIGKGEAWVDCMIKKPSLWSEAWYKRIFFQKGHIVIAQQKTEASHCYDIIFLYMWSLCEDHEYKDYVFYDSKGDYSHAFKLKIDSNEYLVRWDEKDGFYSLSSVGSEQATYTPKEILTKIEDLVP